MAEYIKREAAVKAANEWVSEACKEPVMRLIRLFDKLQKVPAVDAVVVTRCKGCKHYRNHPNGLCYLHTEPKANGRGYSGEAVCVEPDDFCSYGEPKEGNHA